MLNNHLISVAVAVIYNGAKDQVLITKRAEGKYLSGMWEFPGGKLELEESPEQALSRELLEELAIEPIDFSPLMFLSHEYPDLSVILHVFSVFTYSGSVRALENQPFCWVDFSELKKYEFPEANNAIVSSILLPKIYQITSDIADKERLLAQISAGLKQGVRLFQLRVSQLDGDLYLHCAKTFSSLCADYNAMLMLKGSIHLLNESWCQGLHLTSQQLSLLAQQGWRHKNTKWLAASCHNKDELCMATEIGCNFVTLSPVFETQTHPIAHSLGYEQAAELTFQSTLPVFWLGGMKKSDLKLANEAGALGVAGISCFYDG